MLLSRKTYSVWGILRPYTGAVEQEPNGRHLLSLTVTERIHQLFELCRPLDLEEHFVVVVRHLDVEVLHGGGRRVAGGGFRHG